MSKVRVYDVPTRVFHFFFALIFIAAFSIAKLIDDESAVYPVHMLLGLLMSFVIVLRIIWGIFGTHHAQFIKMPLAPSKTLSYFKKIIKGDLSHKYQGHNPASSWVGILMMLFGLGLGVTGYLMSLSHDNKEQFEDVHELLANGFLILVIIHVVGIILHTIRHKEIIGLSMISGEKEIENAEVTVAPHYFVGVVYLFSVLSFGYFLYSHYDQKTQTLNVLGTSLVLGEVEDSKDSSETNSEEKEDEDDEDKD